MASLSLEKLVIPFSQLGSEDEMFEYFVRPDFDREDEIISFPQKVKVSARVQKVEDNYLLFLTVTGMCNLMCDRCGESYAYQIDSTINTLFSFSKLGLEDEGDSEVRIIYTSEHGLDIGQDVRDAISLAIPAKHLCREDCKGLCARCGKNLNEEKCQCDLNTIDPRWDALKNVKFDS